MLFKIFHAQNQVTKFDVPWKTCHLAGLKRMEIQNAKTSTGFLKKSKYLKKEK